MRPNQTRFGCARLVRILPQTTHIYLAPKLDVEDMAGFSRGFAFLRRLASPGSGRASWSRTGGDCVHKRLQM